MSTEGWKCPVCGRGNAPFSPHCDCYREDKPKQQQGKPLDNSEFQKRAYDQLGDLYKQQSASNSYPCTYCTMQTLSNGQLRHERYLNHHNSADCPHKGKEWFA